MRTSLVDRWDLFAVDVDTPTSEVIVDGHLTQPSTAVVHTGWSSSTYWLAHLDVLIFLLQAKFSILGRKGNDPAPFYDALFRQGVSPIDLRTNKQTGEGITALTFSKGNAKWCKREIGCLFRHPYIFP